MTEKERHIFVHNVREHKYPIVFVFPNEKEEECNELNTICMEQEGDMNGNRSDERTSSRT